MTLILILHIFINDFNTLYFIYCYTFTNSFNTYTSYIVIYIYDYYVKGVCNIKQVLMIMSKGIHYCL